MPSLDAAGVVGTWVAAGLALIALIGIAGPILIWRASRPERHKAIVAIGQRNYNYVLKGILIWPGIRLAQRVPAPRINHGRKFKDEEWKSFNTKNMEEHEAKALDSPVSWVYFGAFLDGYQIHFDTDSDVVVSSGFAFLPVSKAFLMTFALIGRFSGEQDRKRKIKVSTVRKWDRRYSKKFNRADLELGNRQMSRFGTSPDVEIHGLTGSLYFAKPNGAQVANDPVKNAWSVVFVGESILEPFAILQDPIGLTAIGLLSLVFFPFQNNEFINVLDPVPLKDEDSDNSDNDENEAVRGYSRRVSGPQRRKTSTPAGPGILRHNKRSLVSIVAYELLEIIVTEAEILRYFPTNDEIKYSALYEIEVDAKTRSELRDLSEQTFVPATQPWVRLVASGYDSDSACYFIRREDAQKIALSLINIPWHPEGYLIPGAADEEERAKLMSLLSYVSSRTRAFIIRLKEGVTALGLNSNDQQAFTEAAEQVIKKIAVSSTRSVLLNAVYMFDEFMKRFQHENVTIQQMTAILVLTNVEFTELLYQSSRHMTATSNINVEFDLQAGIMIVPGTFGTLQTFEVDMHAVFKGELQLGRRGKISVSHSDILKAAL